MAISSLSDALRAYDEGRVHLQRFTKGFFNASSTRDGMWQDWSFAPGQPAYDARVGVPLEFTPFVAQRNDAIWFPGIEAGQTRHLTEVTFRTRGNGSGQASISALVYDLVGVYPLIDGDSTEVQPLINDQSATRYADGAGLFPVLVNHVAPAVTNAAVELTYLDHSGVKRLTSFGTLNPGGTTGFVTTAPANSAGAGAQGGLSVPMVAGSRGARACTSIRFLTPPGGLFALYMYRPLLNVLNNDGVGDGSYTVAAVKGSLLQNGWHAPRVHDGANLGMFLMTRGGSRAVANLFGTMEFIWG